MHQTLNVKRLRVLPLFKPIAVGWACIWLPVALIAGITSLFGARTVTFNDRVVTGMPGLLTAIMIGVIGPAMFAIVFCVMAGVGLWLYSRLFGGYAISFTESDRQSRERPNQRLKLTARVD